MAIERVIDNVSHEDDTEEQVIEVSLRPTSFQEYVGQERLKRNLKTRRWYLARSRPSLWSSGSWQNYYGKCYRP